jgi:FkbM family methyltransferase
MTNASPARTFPDAARAGRWAQEVACYARETRSARGMAALMQVRLALSRAGRLAAPRPCTRDVAIRSLGGRVRLRSHTTDISVLNELIVSGGYDPAAVHVPTPATILDLGANTGLAARWLMARWPAARLAAVEPEPGNVAVLEANLAGTPAQVLAVAAGGWAREAVLSTSSGEHGYTITGEQGDGAVRVPVVTMPVILAEAGMTEAGVGLLKVDIEGAEAELFADCSAWIRQVNALVVECHGGYTAKQLLADCRAAGAEFALADLDSKPEWGFEVVTAVRAGA